MDQQTINFYSTIFNRESKDVTFYKTFYSTLVHFEGLKSVLVSNLAKEPHTSANKQKIDINRSITVQLLNRGIELLEDVSGFKSETANNEQEEDITNISTTKVLDFEVFKNIDEELQHELVTNILKIIRTIISAVVETDNSDLITNPEVKYNLLFRVTAFLFTSYSAHLDFAKVSPAVLSIFKEIIYLLYDYLIIVTSIDYSILDDFQNFGFLDSFQSLLEKTHPSYLNGEVTKMPTTKLSLETLIRTFSSISILCVNRKPKIDLEDDDKFKEWVSQFDQILRYNLKLSYDYSPDLYQNTIMNESFFNWMTSNYLNFSNAYLNETTIKGFKPSTKDMENTLNKRFKDSKALSFEYYDPLEFLGITLYICTLTKDKKILEKFVHEEVFHSWICLASYVLTYQFRSVKLQLATRAILIMFQRILQLETIKDLTIDEYKWKLCHQKSPIVPPNKADGESKPLTSYILDNISVLLRFNVNKKLHIETFVEAVKMVESLLSQFPADDNYNYDELYKSIVKLFVFNVTYIKNQLLTDELCNLFEIVLTSNIKSYLIYQILLNVDKFDIDLSKHAVLKELIEFLYAKFDLKNDDSSKINLLDSDYDSPELFDNIQLFSSDAKIEPSPVTVDIKDVFKHL